jgi:hypothetical protein
MPPMASLPCVARESSDITVKFCTFPYETHLSDCSAAICAPSAWYVMDYNVEMSHKNASHTFMYIASSHCSLPAIHKDG